MKSKVLKTHCKMKLPTYQSSLKAPSASRSPPDPSGTLWDCPGVSWSLSVHLLEPPRTSSLAWFRVMESFRIHLYTECPIQYYLKHLGSSPRMIFCCQHYNEHWTLQRNMWSDSPTRISSVGLSRVSGRVRGSFPDSWHGHHHVALLLHRYGTTVPPLFVCRQESTTYAFAILCRRILK